MNVTVELPQPAPKPSIKYPCLMQSKHGRLVLFSENEKGMVLHDPKGFWEIGKVCSSWDMGCFKPVPKGTRITIEV